MFVNQPLSARVEPSLLEVRATTPTENWLHDSRNNEPCVLLGTQHRGSNRRGSCPVDETAQMVNDNGEILLTRPTHAVMDSSGIEIEAFSLSAGSQHACAMPTTNNQDRLVCWGNVPFIAQSGHEASSITLSELAVQMHIHSVDRWRKHLRHHHRLLRRNRRLLPGGTDEQQPHRSRI